MSGPDETTPEPASEPVQQPPGGLEDPIAPEVLDLIMRGVDKTLEAAKGSLSAADANTAQSAVTPPGSRLDPYMVAYHFGSLLMAFGVPARLVSKAEAVALEMAGGISHAIQDVPNTRE